MTSRRSRKRSTKDISSAALSTLKPSSQPYGISALTTPTDASATSNTPSQLSSDERSLLRSILYPILSSFDNLPSLTYLVKRSFPTLESSLQRIRKVSNDTSLPPSSGDGTATVEQIRSVVVDSFLREVLRRRLSPSEFVRGDFKVGDDNDDNDNRPFPLPSPQTAVLLRLSILRHLPSADDADAMERYGYGRAMGIAWSTSLSGHFSGGEKKGRMKSKDFAMDTMWSLVKIIFPDGRGIVEIVAGLASVGWIREECLKLLKGCDSKRGETAAASWTEGRSGKKWAGDIIKEEGMMENYDTRYKEDDNDSHDGSDDENVFEVIVDRSGTKTKNSMSSQRHISNKDEQGDGFFFDRMRDDDNMIVTNNKDHYGKSKVPCKKKNNKKKQKKKRKIDVEYLIDTTRISKEKEKKKLKGKEEPLFTIDTMEADGDLTEKENESRKKKNKKQNKKQKQSLESGIDATILYEEKQKDEDTSLEKVKKIEKKEIVVVNKVEEHDDPLEMDREIADMTKTKEIQKGQENTPKKKEVKELERGKSESINKMASSGDLSSTERGSVQKKMKKKNKKRKSDPGLTNDTPKSKEKGKEQDMREKKDHGKIELGLVVHETESGCDSPFELKRSSKKKMIKNEKEDHLVLEVSMNAGESLSKKNIKLHIKGNIRLKEESTIVVDEMGTASNYNYLEKDSKKKNKKSAPLFPSNKIMTLKENQGEKPNAPSKKEKKPSKYESNPINDKISNKSVAVVDVSETNETNFLVDLKVNLDNGQKDILYKKYKKTEEEDNGNKNSDFADIGSVRKETKKNKKQKEDTLNGKGKRNESEKVDLGLAMDSIVGNDNSSDMKEGSEEKEKRKKNKDKDYSSNAAISEGNQKEDTLHKKQNRMMKDLSLLDEKKESSKNITLNNKDLKGGKQTLVCNPEGLEKSFVGINAIPLPPIDEDLSSSTVPFSSKKNKDGKKGGKMSSSGTPLRRSSRRKRGSDDSSVVNVGYPSVTEGIPLEQSTHKKKVTSDKTEISLIPEVAEKVNNASPVMEVETPCRRSTRQIRSVDYESDSASGLRRSSRKKMAVNYDLHAS
uniref:Uncharacterized protein n=1 Tax=Corethron hystrix TaxID=216773 RepID=A0A7S1BZP6_9STRA|mmetsp:Transcript_8351/g.18230  ORF Transcript_8351/g.18230 Transcript_8351/m.18230 type:complete len:1069 (+) Transcript_8351:51-3257(+)